MEVAGLSLAVFSFIVRDLSFFQNASSVKNNVRRLEMERVRFRNTCQRLLEGLVPPEDVDKLLEGWDDRVFHEALQSRLPAHSRDFLAAATKLLFQLQSLRDVLGLSVGNSYELDPSSQRRRYKRIRLIDKKELLAVLDGISWMNTELERLVSSLPTHTPSRRTPSSPSFASPTYSGPSQPSEASSLTQSPTLGPFTPGQEPSHEGATSPTFLHNPLADISLGVEHDDVDNVAVPSDTLESAGSDSSESEISSFHSVAHAHRRRLRLLSLDGGGVRGISSLVILKHLMSSLEESGAIAKGTRPWEYFDLIAGTSTGGIIAILLGRLCLSIDECIDLYENLGGEIFGKAKSLHTGTMFSSSKLEETIRRIVDERTGVGSALLQQYSGGQLCPVFVVAIDKERANLPDAVTLFRSYYVPNDQFRGVSIVEAVRATSAAPTFFKPMRISNSTETKYFVDGGLGHNNPILHLIEEAEMMYPSAEIGCIVSLGTGVQQGLKLAAEGTVRTNMLWLPFFGKLAAKLDAALVAAALATSSEHIHRFAESKFRGTGIYYRFNVCEQTDIKLFEHRKMGAMVKATNEYLKQASTAEFTRKCVARLQNLRVDLNPRHTRRTFSSPNDIQTLIESTVNPTILETIRQQPVETTWDIPPEMLWSQCTDYEVFPTMQLEEYAAAEGLPFGHLTLLFNILHGGQIKPAAGVPPGPETGRRHRFQPQKPVHVPPGRWRAGMAYMLMAGAVNQREEAQSGPSAGGRRNSNSEACIMLGISVFAKRGNALEPEPTVPIYEAATVSVPVPKGCAAWALIESGASFEVNEGDQVIFEVWWDLANVSEETPHCPKLHFGGIRLTSIDD
ncbi:acyl transferase/acyl hydrolase/lysophospholipase [Sphaerosporella brunnea]|uniref:Acyl transferase/acyl hydrolase/lysophospholipase n=1 Tax=Sphaerosporella brunnea TaxID=1250544 RepID=A0A5J5F1L6_9PEZI|nr:acyl transferase/acyl hydrolase/lysophospholipase [Sphaerosporella brunnea]